MTKVTSKCSDCGKVFEKTAETPSTGEIAEQMVSYLARRHREKTGHTTSPISKAVLASEPRSQT